MIRSYDTELFSHDGYDNRLLAHMAALSEEGEDEGDEGGNLCNLKYSEN